MSQGPRRLIEDPEWGGAFEGLVDEHGRIEGLPDDIRADVAAMVLASVAGAVGVASAGAAASSIASAGGSAVTSGVVSSGAVTSGALSSGAVTSGALSSGAVTSGAVTSGAVTSAVAGGVGSASATAAASGVAVGGGVLAGGAGLASSVGAASALGSMGAASASVAALGIVPKVIFGMSLAGAVTFGGVAAVNETPTRQEETEASSVAEGVEIDPEKKHDRERAQRIQKTPSAELGGGIEATQDRARHDEKLAGDLVGGDQPAESSEKISEESIPPVASGAAATGLAGEVNLLKRARSALSVNREYAWTLLNEYHRRYPQGALRSEYEVLVRRVQTNPK